MTPLERQLVSDVPLCTLLSGGLDSSALTAHAVHYYEETGQGNVHTFSVDYVDNDKHFKAHDFQPNADAPWIERMTSYLQTEHHPIAFDTPELVDTPTIPAPTAGSNSGGNDVANYGYFAGPMAYDIAAMQDLYGANGNFHNGSDTYWLPDQNALGTYWTCIWDPAAATASPTAAAAV